ncbi:LuxR C-terminal-related transcriptional regulator [Citricoccus sp. NPDC055426]|uniref:LuxR C-terminal-related transcriptional regulator n=1 Tax=Citricoccus sp. NPDC055426 TaxID=3155536 RepID=UPI00344A99D7
MRRTRQHRGCADAVRHGRTSPSPYFTIAVLHHGQGGFTAAQTASARVIESTLRGGSGWRRALEHSPQLFLSPRTIKAHLRSIFRKPGITSRRQLREIPLP